MKKIIASILLVSLLLTSCGLFAKPEPTPIPPTPTEISTPTPLPGPAVLVTTAPDSRQAAETFLTNWQVDDTLGMYNMLAQVSRDAVSYEDFLSHYTDFAKSLTLQSLSTEITSVLTNPTSAQIGYHATYETALGGEFARDMVMNMVFESGDWKIQWEDGMIMPELRGGNKIVSDITLSPRGPIFDIDGVPLASETSAYAIGVVPASVEQRAWNGLTNELSRLTGLTNFVIKQKIDEAQAYDYVVIGEVPAQLVKDRFEILSNYTGLYLTPYDAGRFYYEDGIAPHVVGYVQSIGKDEADARLKEGYRIDERIGRLGIEKWAQKELAGERGVSLYVVDPQGNAVTRLAKSESTQGQSVYTTFKEDFQYDLQRAIAGFNAAVVVMEMNTGRVLGMASSPTFDPNLLDWNNYNAQHAGKILGASNRPMYNRASQGQYPLGSVFKIIAMAAALESGIYEASSQLDCPYEFTELPGVTLTDWTLEKEVAPSGMLTLSEGLMRSCNPWFYKIGLELFRQKGADYFPSMVRAFGLGQLTKIGEIEEEPGFVETPYDEFSAVQMGIGQGKLLVTPLQVARFIAAVGNGGKLYRPQVVEQILDADENVVYAFEPDVQGELPVSPEHLASIQEAMLSVTANQRGTAYHVFKNHLRFNVHAKTGTAQTGIDPNAWFAGYTNYEAKSGKPDIAIAVLVENMGDGSYYAAPIFRRALELYYDGKASSLYNWEAAVYVTKTVTPTPTATPTPVPTKAPWEITPEPTEEANEG